MPGYAIVGAGCAGLSLAVHLVEAGFREPLHLFDRRRTFDDDRTWCAFRVDPHRFVGCVSKRWSRVRICAQGKNVVAQLHTHPYEYIAAKDFYAEALAALRAASNVTLHLGVDAEALAGAKVRSEGNVIDFAHVFDSRFDVRELPGGLWQCFAGVVVETEAPRFEPECATLMDFDAGEARPDAVQFRYVLPFSPHQALIEDTFFGRRRIEAGAALPKWLSDLGPHRVLRRESGALPMSAALGATHHAGVTPIGLAGGAAKPSSGYAFDFIQRHSKALVLDSTAPMPRSRMAGVLDQILLDELERDPQVGPGLFRRLFERNNGDRVARFLMERASPRDTAAIMASIPSTRLVSGGVLWPYRRFRERL